MSYVELGVKEYRRLLSIMSEYFGKKIMTKQDTQLRKKLEVMLESELELEEE